MKNVTLNTALTPAPLASAASALIGEQITPARERWSIGALIGSVLGRLEDPAVALFGPAFALIYTPQPAAVGDELEALATSGAGTLHSEGQHIAFEALPGTSSRSRALSIDGVTVTPASSSYALSYSQDVVAAALLEPSPPVLSLSQALGRMIDALEARVTPPANWYFLVNQVTGKIFFIEDGQSLTAATAAAAVDALSAPWDLVAAYTLTDDADEPEGPSVESPLWG